MDLCKTVMMRQMKDGKGRCCDCYHAGKVVLEVLDFGGRLKDLGHSWKVDGCEA